MKGAIDWAARDAELRALFAQNKTAAQIAALLGPSVTRNAVIGRIHRLNLRGTAVQKLRGDKKLLKGTVRPLRKAAQMPSLVNVGREGDTTALRPPRRSFFGTEAEVRVNRHLAKREKLDDGGLSARRKAARAEVAPAPVLPVGRVFESFAHGFGGQQGRVALVDLEPQHCRYPIDMEDGSTLFCGDMKEERGSYCPAHAARCYNDGARP